MIRAGISDETTVLPFLNDEERAEFTADKAPILRKLAAIRRSCFYSKGGVIDLDWYVGTGPHALEACENNMFRLAGSTLEAIEDPDDGYRSALEHVLVHESYKLAKNIAPVMVRIEVAPPTGGDGDDARWTMFRGHRLVDVETGRLVILVGTDNTDDYYPSFTFFYRPIGAP